MYEGLFHSISITYGFALFLCRIGAIMLLTVYYPRHLKKSMGAMGKKMSSFLLTQYTDSCLEIFLNNIIKMWEQFRFLEFAFIILFILIEQIFLMSSSDLVSMLSTTIAGYRFLLGDPIFLCAIIPIKIYSNAETDKDQILSENKNKSGIYMWTNNINNKRYVGSSENLRARFMQYFNINYLIRDNSMWICRALLKHGYENFSLTIIEYCEPEKCLEREKYYIDLGAEYNIVKDQTIPPMSGRKHSDATKTIMSDAKKGITGENHPKFGKNHSDESKKIMSEALKGRKLSDKTKQKISDAMPNSIKIEVSDIKNNITTFYDSMHEAARELNLPNHMIIYNYIKNNQKKPYKGKYTFKRAPKN